MLTPKRSAILGLAVVLPMLVPAVVSARAQSGCDAASQVSFPDEGRASLLVSKSDPGPRINFLDVAVPAIPAGTYEIDTVAYDGYPDRTNTSVQPYEILRLQFLDAGGVVIDQTAATADLVDGVEYAEWKGSVGPVVLDRAAVTVRAIHAYLGQAESDRTANSLQPECAGWTLVETTTTTTTTTTSSTTSTTTTTTTEQPTGTTSEPPVSTSSVPGESTTTTTTPPAPTTTSSVPTQVLPEVEFSPDPEPQVATPTFTG